MHLNWYELYYFNVFCYMSSWCYGGIMDILQFVYYIEKMIMLGISSIVSLIKKQPENFVADVVIGGVLLYLAILIIRCILHAISFRYPILNRKCRKIISFLNFRLAKWTSPFKLVLTSYKRYLLLLP